MSTHEFGIYEMTLVAGKFQNFFKFWITEKLAKKLQPLSQAFDSYVPLYIILLLFLVAMCLKSFPNMS